MKRCPQCNRVEADDSLAFCRSDGVALVSDLLAPGNEAGTARLGSGSPATEIDTSLLPHTTGAGIPRATGPSTVLPSNQPQASTSSAEFGEIKKHKLGVALGALMLLAVLGVGLWFFFLRTSSEAINSIAVLPFTNATGDKEIDFLSEGIAETLINNFTKIPELKVTARSTAFRFRGREGEPKEVGRELGVGSVLTGKLLQRGDALTVQVDLINTSNGIQIWGNRYEGKSADIVSIQQRIATDVSSQLKLKLTGAQQQQVTKIYTQNSDAYQHYLRGRYYWNRRTADGMRMAISEFQQAVDKDPSYALGYSGLADSYMLLEEYAGARPKESLAKARVYVQKALEFDPSLGEAYAALGLINHYSLQFQEAESAFKRAIELNPNYPSAHQWYSGHLRDTGRLDEFLAEIKRAHELDPLSGIAGVNVGIAYVLKGDVNAAVSQLNRIIELDRNWWAGHTWLGLIYLKVGRNEEAVPLLKKSLELNRTNRTLGFLSFALASTGKRTEAMAILKESEELYAKGESNAFHIAGMYAGLGDKEQAFSWLEKAYEDRTGELVRVGWHPQFDSLRDDPRFKVIRKRMNLPD